VNEFGLGIRAIAISTQQGIDKAMKKTAAGVGSPEDSDRGYSSRESRVLIDQLGKPQLAELEGLVLFVIDCLLALFKLFGIGILE